MKLIDADKLENDIAENITVKAVSRMLAITQGQPTVKAIPIEWLKKQVEIYFDLGLDTIAKELKYLIFEWEKENEAN